MSEFQAVAVPPASTTTLKVPIILDKADDWWTWLAFIKQSAQARKIWQYIDPNDETNETDEPEEPHRPDPEVEFEDMTSEQKSAWNPRLKRHDEAMRKYEREQAGLINLTGGSLSSSRRSSSHPNQPISRISRIDSMTCARSQLIGTWENFIGECEELELSQYTGYSATSAFLDAIEPILPGYAEIRQEKLEEDIDLGVYDEINAFRKKWEKRSLRDKRSKSAFATLQGQSDQPSRSSTRPSGQARGTRPRTCVCGESHQFDDCPILFPASDHVAGSRTLR